MSEERFLDLQNAQVNQNGLGLEKLIFEAKEIKKIFISHNHIPFLQLVVFDDKEETVKTLLQKMTFSEQKKFDINCFYMVKSYITFYLFFCHEKVEFYLPYYEDNAEMYYCKSVY